MKANFTNHYTQMEKDFIRRMAVIEQEDKNACDSCGGEDCQCCEIYHDRSKWVDPSELFEDRY